MSSLRFLTANLAQKIDEELMGAVGAFSLDQLMELAGLACAQALAAVYGREKYPKVLVCCGPGNQGGDGLVAARHLAMFGYKPTVYLPKPGNKEIYQRLKTQCQNNNIRVLSSIDQLKESLEPGESHCILDAIFGFSFKPPVRAPFDEVLSLLNASDLPIVSVDIPSGWDVEKGPVELETQVEGKGNVQGVKASVLVSLTAPKLGVRSFKGRHFLGGRFVPKEMEDKFELNLPEYPGSAQVVELFSDSSNL